MSGPKEYIQFQAPGGASFLLEITDPESFNEPPDLNAFRDMIERRIPDAKDPDRVTAYHLLKAYRKLSGR